MKDLRFNVSLNYSLYNKNVGGSLNSYRDFHVKYVSVEELKAHIAKGYAFGAAMNKPGTQRSANFSSSGLISIDVDSGMTLQQALDNEYLRKWASFLYTTCSHTEEKNRYRIIFLLNNAIKSAAFFSKLTYVLSKKLGGDPRTTDAARISYGNSEAKIYDFGRVLEDSEIKELLAGYQENASDWSCQSKDNESRRSRIIFSADHIIRVQGGAEVELSKIGNNTAVHCPIHLDNNASARVYRGRRGNFIRCFRCKETFWPSGTSSADYDFDLLDKALIECAAVGRDKIKLTTSEVSVSSTQVFEKRYLPDFTLNNGITFIKSPKGSGKTEFISKHAAIALSKRVLVIGHRQTLVRAMCDRLGLFCYLDNKNGDQDPVKISRYGVCLDSLSKIGGLASYDLVILDEAEQILDHFSSDTMKEKRHDNMLTLIRVLNSATRIVALDADLSALSVERLTEFTRFVQKDNHFILNQYSAGEGRLIEIFRSKNHLVGDLLTSVERGNRCYVVSNSKTLIDEISTHIEKRDTSIRLLRITSDDSKVADSEAKEFIRNPIESAEKYQIVLSSPALSSGVDLTFPDGDEFYQNVYGFFEGGVTTHFDCDQQIARVRNPGAVKVFISPRKMWLDSDPVAVEHDLRAASLFGYLKSSNPFEEINDRDDDLLTHLVAVTCRYRASVNDFAKNFIDYKLKAGWRVQEAEVDVKLSASGGSAMKVGSAGAKEKRFARLLDAQALDPDDLRGLIEKIARGTLLKKDEKAALDRARYENFYRREIFDELISLEESVGLSNKVRTYEALAAGSLGLPRRASDAVVHSDRIRLKFLSDAFKAAGIYGDRGFIDDAVITDGSLEAFKDFLRHNKAIYEAQFDNSLRKDLDRAPIKQLNDLLEACRLKTELIGTATNDGKKTYRYRISTVRLKGLRKLQTIRLETPTSWPEIDAF